MGILKDFPTYGSVISNTPPGSIKSVGVQEGKDTAGFPRAIIDLMVNAICTALESLDGIGT
jgi:hypothetical protein